MANDFGLSPQSPGYHRELEERLHLPFALLSDAQLVLRQALDLPFFEAGGMTLLHRLTLIISDGKIQHGFENIEDPVANAAAVLDYLAAGYASEISG